MKLMCIREDNKQICKLCYIFQIYAQWRKLKQRMGKGIVGAYKTVNDMVRKDIVERA